MTMALNSLTDIADDPIKTRYMPARFLFLGFGTMELSVGLMTSMLRSIHAMVLGGLLFEDMIEDVVANARDYHKNMEFYEAGMFSIKPLIIIIKGDVLFTEDSDKSLGYYASRFFSKILEDATGKAYEMVSNEVFGSDFNHFRFVLMPVTNN